MPGGARATGNSFVFRKSVFPVNARRDMVVNEGPHMNEPTLAFACPVCGNPMLIPDSLRGRELQCPHENCGTIFQTPALDEPVQHEDESTQEPPAPGSTSEGAKSRRKQMPKGPGLKRKGPPAGPRPTRTAPAKPPVTGGESSPPGPPKPPAPKAAMGTGTKLSYLLGVVIVVGAVIYHKTAKRTPPAGGPTPAATVQAPAASPARNTSNAATAAPRAVSPVPVAPPAGKKKGKEMTEEDRNRFNDSLTKADAEKREADRKEFTARMEKAEGGSKTAQYDVGMKYLNGVGVEPDRAKAREWLDKAAAQKYASAFNGLGELDALEGRRDEAIAHFVKAGDLCVDGFVNDEPKAKSVVYKALEQLQVLGAHDEHAALAAKTTKKDEPMEATAPEVPTPAVAPAAPEAQPSPPVPEPAPVLELPPLPDPPPPVELPPEPDPPPPAPAPDAPSGEIKEP